MARLGVLATDNATVRRLELIAGGFRHKCVARAMLAEHGAIANLFERWLVDASIDAVVAVATDATRAIVTPKVTEAFAGVAGVEGGRCGKKLVVLVPEVEEAARAPLGAVMPRIDAILGLKLATLAPKVVAAPPNMTIPLDDADLLPRYGQTNRTIQLDHADLEPMPATNTTIQLGDGDIEASQAAPTATSRTIQLGDDDIVAQQAATTGESKRPIQSVPTARGISWRVLAPVLLAVAIATAAMLALGR